MGIPPPSRGMKTVPNLLMLNFLYWLATAQKDAYSKLQFLPPYQLMQLVHEFEQARPDVEHRQEADWQQSVQSVFVESAKQDEYSQVRRTYGKLLKSNKYVKKAQ